MMIFFIFSVISIQISSTEAVMPEYLPVNRAVSLTMQSRSTLHLDSLPQKFLVSFLMSMEFR